MPFSAAMSRRVVNGILDAIAREVRRGGVIKDRAMAESGARRASTPLSEEGLIARYFAPLAQGLSRRLGLRDDAAVIAPPPARTWSSPPTR